MSETILSVQNLHTSFTTGKGEVHAVNGVSFDLDTGKILGIVGESGSGKSVTAYSIMRILESNGRIEEGSVLYKGKDVTKFTEKEMRDFRGKCCSIIFLDAMTSLNPVFTVGSQLREAIELHTSRKGKEAEARAIEMLTLVGVNEPEKRIKQYPYEFSGGMRQRVMIAMALCCNPKLLIADEPTTALDVTIQAQIMELIRDLQKEIGMSVILITHDIGLVAQMADRVFVMYAGQIIEMASVKDLFYHPAHPYTKALLDTVPGIYDESGRTLASIPGIVPENYDQITGCRFADRCAFAGEGCEKKQEMREIEKDHFVRCHKADRS